tara:strand:+ start:46 stop:657 length:612 start_codon:yes stop_codon:yes gene_type:complete
MVPEFYKNTLGSSILYSLLPLDAMWYRCCVHDKKYGVTLQIFAVNLFLSCVASLLFWEKYDFDSWEWEFDKYVARCFLLNCLVNNVLHLSVGHALFFSVIPLGLYIYSGYTKSAGDYEITLFCHLLFRYLLFCNSVLLLDNNDYRLIKWVTPLYITTCCTVYMFDMLGYWKSVGYVMLAISGTLAILKNFRFFNKDVCKVGKC